jgi:NADPH2:quinone reductase
MRAVWLTEFGGPGVLLAGDAPDPVPGAGQVLIEVVFAGITFVETQFRATGKGPITPELPMIPGNGVGGVVRDVGEGVDGDIIGRRVVTSTGGSGGYAQRVVVDAALLFEVPEGLALDTAVALLADGRTATGLARTAAIGPGERVLVEAAAGGVGGLLVQLAKAAGAEVIGVAGGARKTEHARELGADLVVDYREPGWANRVGPVDVVFDGVGGDIGEAAFSLLRRGGRMLVFGLSSGAWTRIPEDAARERGVTVVRGIGSPAEFREFTTSAFADAAEGRLRPVIGQRFPLDRAADAHAAIEARGTIGKTLLEV